MFALAAISAITLTGLVAAQDYRLDPAYGEVNLSSGFTPDPHIVNLQAGGPLPARNISRQCDGYIADAPDVRLEYAAGSWPLIISTNAQADTTLVINGPDGSRYCDDDGGEGFNASLRFDEPMSGQYDIWVGTYRSGRLPSAQLQISEMYSQ
ncbi:peptidase S1 [Alkalicaulis satelles]|uniref:Peptidase S1 n=2 Tax=Alkalicaulis satelles TaxID=2609175 RepID=A0A5M6ZLK7_9PROT|nr:peptidase S1 [Alkalicaulis satelles]